MSTKPILICGDVEGEWDILFHHVNILNKDSEFEFLLVTGSFFPLLHDHKKPPPAPIPTYILGPVNESQLSYYHEVKEGGEIAENIKYLGPSGIFTSNTGLKIAYISGAEFNGPSELRPEWCFNYETVRDLKDKAEIDGIFPGDVDICLSCPWPYPLDDHPTNAKRPSTLMTILSRIFQVKYHFAAGGESMYFIERKDDYFNSNPYPHSFFGLSKVATGESSNFLYKLDIRHTAATDEQRQTFPAMRWGYFESFMDDETLAAFFEAKSKKDDTDRAETTRPILSKEIISSLVNSATSLSLSVTSTLAPFVVVRDEMGDSRPYIQLSTNLTILKEAYELQLIFPKLKSNLRFSISQVHILQIHKQLEQLGYDFGTSKPLQKLPKKVQLLLEDLRQKESQLVTDREKVEKLLEINNITMREQYNPMGATVLLGNLDLDIINQLAKLEWDHKMRLCPSAVYYSCQAPCRFELSEKIKLEANALDGYWKRVCDLSSTYHKPCDKTYPDGIGNVAVLDSWRGKCDLGGEIDVNKLHTDYFNACEQQWHPLMSFNANQSPHGIAVSNMISCNSPPGVKTYIFKAAKFGNTFPHEDICKCFRQIIPQNPENVARNIKLVNCSFESRLPDPDQQVEIKELLQDCNRYGIIVVFSSGNDPVSKDVSKFYANPEHAIIVGSYWKHLGTICELSTGGFNVDTLAPPLSEQKFKHLVEKSATDRTLIWNDIELCGTSFSAPRVVVGLLHAKFLLHQTKDKQLDLHKTKELLRMSNSEISSEDGQIKANKGFDPDAFCKKAMDEVTADSSSWSAYLSSSGYNTQEEED